MHHSSPRQILIGLTVSWLLVLFAEGWRLIDGGMTVRAGQRVLAQKRLEAARLAALDPAPTAAQTARIETELAAAEEVMDRLQAEFADGEGAGARPAGTSGTTDSRTDVPLDGEDFVRDLHERARLAGVGVRPEEKFGLAVAGRGVEAPVGIAAQRRGRVATGFLVRALLAAHPSQLLSLQCARPHGATPGGPPARLPLGDAGTGAGDLFDFDSRHSVQEAGAVETVPIRLTFTGRTAALRQFLNQLPAGRQIMAISEIAVEPVATTGSLHHGKSAGAEPVVEVVQPALSQFVVTVEFCELALPPAAGNGKTPAAAHLPIDGGASGMGDLPAVTSGEGWVLPKPDGLTQTHGQDARAAAVVPAGTGSLPCGWRDPMPQPRGRGWIYEVFTPPALFHDRRSRALAAVPAEEGTLADPESPPFDLQLLQVRKRPFRLRLVGFAGESENLRGIFADATGKTVIGREGERLAGHRVWLEHLSLERAGSGNKGTCAPVATATVTDEGTGEEIVLTTRGPSPAGAPLGWFASRKNPASRRALKEGESAVFEGVRYCVERIELDPPLAVVMCAPADGLKATNHALILQISPEALRGIPVLTATEQVSRDLPATR
jgi:hypothetical protein